MKTGKYVFAQIVHTSTLSLTANAAYAWYFIDEVYLRADTITSLTTALLADYGFSCYPNPNNGSFTIRLNALAEKVKLQFNVTDALGKAVYQLNPLENSCNYSSTFELNLEAGIYFIIGSFDNNIFSKKIIVK